MQLLSNARIAGIDGKSGQYGLSSPQVIAIDGGRIAWVGEESAIPAAYLRAARHDLGGRAVTPGLIDCHTHVVFGGDRAREFEMRLEGASYQQIAQAGGGILSTVRATRDTDEADLLASALRRVDALLAEGVTTIEEALRITGHGASDGDV